MARQVTETQAGEGAKTATAPRFTGTTHAQEVESHALQCATARAGWPVGPWTNEPDRIEWMTAAGFTAIMLRQSGSGHWCGYVGVAPGHQWHGVALDSYPDGVEHPDVHGGITYSAECVGAVCHAPAPGEPEHLWWVGFDCAHCDDASPRDARDFGDRFPRGTYRDVSYVRHECERLASQAAQVARGESLEAAL